MGLYRHAFPQGTYQSMLLPSLHCTQSATLAFAAWHITLPCTQHTYFSIQLSTAIVNTHQPIAP